MAALREGPDDVVVEHRTIVVDGVDVPVIHARTEGMPKAGVVIHPDIMGVRPLFEDMARRLASHRLAVVVVEPFARIDAETRAATTDPMARFAWIGGLNDTEQIGDLTAAADLLVVEDDVHRVSVVGFCMGGYYAFKAASDERFDAAVSFYGMVTTPAGWEGAGHVPPLETVADACPTLAVFGSADPYTPTADVDALRAAWADRGDCKIVVIEGAEHGFVHDPDRPAHRSADAATLWETTLNWL